MDWLLDDNAPSDPETLPDYDSLMTDDEPIPTYDDSIQTDDSDSTIASDSVLEQYQHYRSLTEATVMNTTEANYYRQGSSMWGTPLVLLKELQQKCNFDGCTYKNKDHWKMTRHIMVKHLNFKPFKCHSCSFSSYDKWHLERHNRSLNHRLRLS